MNNSKTQKYFLILANFRYFYILLLFIVGVFLFPNTAYLSTINPEKIIDLSNEERTANGLNPLTANQYLGQAAYNKAQAIFENQKFGHNFNDKRFSAWVREVNYEYRYVGENLAIDFVSSEGVVSAWIKSPTHYENIINEKFTEIGVAVIEDTFNNKTSIVVVQIFGTPLENKISLKINNEILNTMNNQGNYLTHSNQNNLNIILDEEIFKNHETDDKTNFRIDKNNKQNLPDLFFALIGLIYLGAFKLVELKNIGL